jgi:hypothetical protein
MGSALSRTYISADGRYLKNDDPMQEAAAITAIGGAAIALIAAYSLWTLRGRK